MKQEGAQTESKEVATVEQEPKAAQLAEQEQASKLPALPIKQTQALMLMIQGVTSTPNMTEETIKIIDRLWEMQKESQDRDAKVAYAEAKARAQKNMPGSVVANQKNEHTKSRYSDLSAVNTEVVPVYAAEGFSLDFKTRKSEIAGELTLVGTLTHEGGHSAEFPLDLPIDDKGSSGNINKTQIQGRASTYQYCQRILVCQIWNIATDRDRDGNDDRPPQQAQSQKPPDYETITDEQALTLHSMVNDLFAELGRTDTGKRADSQMKVLAESMGYKKIGHLPADRYDEAVLKTKSWMTAVKERNPTGEGK